MRVRMGFSGIIHTGNSDADAVLRTPAGVTPEGLVPMCPKRNPNNTRTQRQCKTCGEVKPLEDFPLSKGDTYGRRYHCSPCHSSRNNRYNSRVASEQPGLAKRWRKDSYERNKASVLQRTKAYAKAHPEQGRAKGRRHRAERNGVAVINLTRQEWEAQREYFNYRCAYCHEPLEQDGQDHIVPVSKGGHHAVANVVPACRACNAAKRDRSLIECLLKGYL